MIRENMALIVLAAALLLAMFAGAYAERVGHAREVHGITYSEFRFNGDYSCERLSKQRPDGTKQ